jgi:hypothetical protein
MADRIYGRNFGRVPDELLWDTKVSSDACRLYAALTRYGQQRDKIVPGRKELAERLGWSLDKLDRKTAELEQIGALYVQRRLGAKGEQRTRESFYWIDGRRPEAVPGRTDAAAPGRTDAANDGRTPDPPIDQREIPSPNGDGSSTAQTVLAAFLDRHLKLRLTPQSRARLGERIKTLLLTESESDISAGLDLYASKLAEGKAVTPAWLPGLVDEARNGRPAAGPSKGPPPPPVWKHLTPEQIRERDEQARLAIDDPVPPMRVR